MKPDSFQSVSAHRGRQEAQNVLKVFFMKGAFPPCDA